MKIVVPRGIAASPFEFWIGLAFAISGIGTLMVSARPASIENDLPRWVVLLWGMSLFVGGFALLAGVLRQTASFERLGLRLLASATLLYGVAALSTSGAKALVAALLLFAFTLASFVRLHTIREAERVLEEHRRSHDE